MSFFSLNCKLLKKRWPKVGKAVQQISTKNCVIEELTTGSPTIIFEGIQVSSNYDGEGEAIIQAQATDPKAATVNCYGIGNGLLVKQLLMRPELKTLNLYTLNLALLKACLQSFDHRDWISDNRVNLYYLDGEREIYHPFVALPSELALSDNESSQLRDRVVLELDTEFIRAKKGANNELLKQRVNNCLAIAKTDPDYQVLKWPKDSIAFIAAAGPTLADQMAWLKQARDKPNHVLIAVDVAVKSLLANGIVPHIVVSIDPRGARFFSDRDFQQLAGVPLLYFPILEPDFLKAWPGPRIVSYSSTSLYERLKQDCPRSPLYSGGSVIHPAIDVAVKKGCKKIVLMGADFSFPNGKTHVSWTQDGVTKELESSGIHMAVKDTPHWVINGHGKKVPTYLNFRGYLRDLERYIELCPEVKFFNTSLHGAAISGTTQWPN